MDAATACADAERAVKTPIHLADDDWMATMCALERLSPKARDQRIAELQRQKNAIDASPVWVPRRELVANNLDVLLERAPTGEYVQIVVPLSARPKFPALNRERPFLGSGSVLRFGPETRATTGHYGVTYSALQRITRFVTTDERRKEASRLVEDDVLPPGTHELLADAAQDADFYQWEIPAAHAQTPCDESGAGRRVPCSGQDPDKCAKDGFAAWIEKQTHNALKACKEGDAALSLYWLGFSLHGIQDLAAHKGRTNTEHSYNAHYQQDRRNPDSPAINSSLAQDMSERYLAAVGPALYSACGSILATYKGNSRPLSAETKSKEVGSWTIISKGYNYRFLGRKYPSIAASEPPIRWFKNGDFPGEGAQAAQCEAIPSCETIFQRVLTAAREGLRL